MNFSMKILLFILFASTATVLTQSTDSPTKYDITALLNNSITRTLRNMDLDMIQDLIHNMENHNSFSYEIDTFYDRKPFQNKFYFTGINITILNFESVHVRHEFSAYNMSIFFPKLVIKIEGYLGATNDTVHAGFVRSASFDNISMVAYKLPYKLSGIKPHFYIRYNENFETNYIYTPWFHEDLQLEVQYELERMIRHLIPVLFLRNLKHNENFLQTFHTVFCNDPEKEIRSVHPDFLDHSEQYYYFIPKFTSLNRTLSSITIKGLWNFKSHAFNIHSSQNITILIIKNIRGNANLHYGTQNFTIFPLAFEADCVSIMIDGEMQRVSVTAYNYSVTQTNLNTSLTEYQSKWVMEGIELAIASSIVPSIKIYRNRNDSSYDTHAEHPIVKISTTISQQFHGNAIKKLYQDWNISIPENLNTESNLQLGSSNFNISIYNLPTSSLTPYPDWIECNLYDNLKTSFGIPSFLIGKLSLSNTTHKFDDIDFIMQHIFVELVKRHNSNQTADEFITNVHIEIEVELSQYNFTKNERDAITKKTREIVMSSIKDLLTLFAKPLLSLPLDYCTAPVKIFDDFLPFFADYELPYNIPGSQSNDKFFVSKIHNVRIAEWAMPRVIVVFYEDEDSVSENISSIVSAQFGDTKVRMSFNDTSILSDEMEFAFRKFVLRSFTGTGEVAVTLYYNGNQNYPVLNNVSLSSNDAFWLKGKLQHVIAESFGKNFIKKE